MKITEEEFRKFYNVTNGFIQELPALTFQVVFLYPVKMCSAVESLQITPLFS